MNLGQGSRPDRRVKAREDLIEGSAERPLRLGGGDGVRKGRQMILQARQVLRELGPENIRAGG